MNVFRFVYRNKKSKNKPDTKEGAKPQEKEKNSDEGLTTRDLFIIFAILAIIFNLLALTSQLSTAFRTLQ